MAGVFDIGRAIAKVSTRKKGMEIKATKLKIDMRKRRIFKFMAPRLRDLYVDTLESQHKARPTPSTLDRRGPGQFFKVTGEFIRGVRTEHTNSELKLVTGRLSRTVGRWLQFRVPGVRARQLSKAAFEIYGDLLGKFVVQADENAGSFRRFSRPG